MFLINPSQKTDERLFKGLKNCFIFWGVFICSIIIPALSNGDNNSEGEKVIHWFTPEFKEKVAQFKISPFQAAVIIFCEYNSHVTSVDKLNSPQVVGGLRCIKGDDYVFSSTPYLPEKGMLMDGIYLNGFTGNFRVIQYSKNHPDKFIKDFPYFSYQYYSCPFYAISSKEQWYKVVDKACPLIPKDQRRKWADQEYAAFASKDNTKIKEELKSWDKKFNEMYEFFQVPAEQKKK